MTAPTGSSIDNCPPALGLQPRNVPYFWITVSHSRYCTCLTARTNPPCFRYLVHPYLCWEMLISPHLSGGLIDSWDTRDGKATTNPWVGWRHSRRKPTPCMKAYFWSPVRHGNRRTHRSSYLDKLWMLHAWRCSRLGCMQSWAAWSSALVLGNPADGRGLGLDVLWSQFQPRPF